MIKLKNRKIDVLCFVIYIAVIIVSLSFISQEFKLPSQDSPPIRLNDFNNLGEATLTCRSKLGFDRIVIGDKLYCDLYTEAFSENKISATARTLRTIDSKEASGEGCIKQEIILGQDIKEICTIEILNGSRAWLDMHIFIKDVKDESGMNLWLKDSIDKEILSFSEYQKDIERRYYLLFGLITLLITIPIGLNNLKQFLTK